MILVNMSKNSKSSEALLSEISEKLDKILGVLAIQGHDENTSIRILKGLGLESKEIGNLLGIKGRLRDKKGWRESQN